MKQLPKRNMQYLGLNAVIERSRTFKNHLIIGFASNTFCVPGYTCVLIILVDDGCVSVVSTSLHSDFVAFVGCMLSEPSLSASLQCVCVLCVNVPASSVHACIHSTAQLQCRGQPDTQTKMWW